MEKTTKEKPMKLPKSLAACADMYFELKQKRAAAQRIADEIEKQEKLIKAHLIDNLPKSEASGIAGKLCRVTVVTKAVPQIKDKEMLYKFIKKNNRFDLLQSRLSDAAVKEMWESGKEVPGIEAFNAVTLSVNKI